MSPLRPTWTIVRSTDAVPLAVERTMSWDTRGYGGHGGTSVAPAIRAAAGSCSSWGEPSPRRERHVKADAPYLHG
jgi:hypothetical protein